MRGINPIDGRVYQIRRGKQYSRANTPQPNPQTPAQQYVRGVFARAVEYWQGLPELWINWFNTRAKKKRMTGFNLWISEYMKMFVSD